MTSLMQVLMDFTFTERLPRYLDQDALEASKALEGKHLAAFSVARELR